MAEFFYAPAFDRPLTKAMSMWPDEQDRRIKEAALKLQQDEAASQSQLRQMKINEYLQKQQKEAELLKGRKEFGTNYANIKTVQDAINPQRLMNDMTPEYANNFAQFLAANRLPSAVNAAPSPEFQGLEGTQPFNATGMELGAYTGPTAGQPEMTPQARPAQDVYNERLNLIQNYLTSGGQLSKEFVDMFKEGKPAKTTPINWQDIDGVKYTVGPDGKPVFAPQAKTADDKMELERLRQENRMTLKQMGDAAAKERLLLANTLASQRKEQGIKFRQVPSPVATKLLDMSTNADGIARLQEGFQDRFGGYVSQTAGEVANWAKGVVPMFKDIEQKQWWQDYQSQANLIRNQLFGSALTKTEATEFNKAMINPGMLPDQIKANLTRQSQIAERGLAKFGSAQASQYDPETVSSLTGRTFGAGAAPSPSLQPSGGSSLADRIAAEKKRRGGR